MLVLQIAIVVVLILLNGVLAMSELAVVSSRPARLKAMREQGVGGAGRALELAADPGRFLSTVQSGITLVAVLSGAFSGATLGARLGEWLLSLGVDQSIAHPAGVGIVVAVITYVSLIVGELVPKQLALRQPERIAAMVAPAMTLLARVAAPLVWLLDVSGEGVLLLLGQTGETRHKITDEEIRSLIQEAEHVGTIQSDERRMITGVMKLADRQVRSIMTPRGEVEWLDLSTERATMRKLLAATPHTRLPAGKGSLDELVGVVKTRDILAAMLSRKSFEAHDFVVPAPTVHDNANALDVLGTLQNAEVPMALVHDEYGHFEGLVTPADMLEAIAGAFRSDLGDDEPPATQRDDGSWLLSGYLRAEAMAELLGLTLPHKHDYDTVAGFVLSRMHRLPDTGDHVDTLGWRFEVVDMDGRRIDKVLAQRLPTSRRERRIGK